MNVVPERAHDILLVRKEQDFNRPEKFRLALRSFENKQDHTEKVLPLKSFSILCPNLSSLSVQSHRTDVISPTLVVRH